MRTFRFECPDGFKVKSPHLESVLEVMAEHLGGNDHSRLIEELEIREAMA